MKHVGDVGIHLSFPSPGQGKLSSGGDYKWVLETYSDADWSANKSNRRFNFMLCSLAQQQCGIFKQPQSESGFPEFVRK